MPQFEQFRLPDAGEGLTEAEIVAWHVGVGDRVEVNQPIVEIETAKSLVELPSPFDGVVSELLVPTGTTVAVGTPIIVVDVDPDGPPADGSPAHGAGEHGAGEQGAPASGGVDQGGGAAAGAGSSAGQDSAADDGGAGGAVLVGYGVAAPGAGRRRRRTTGPADGSAGAAAGGAAGGSAESPAGLARSTGPAGSAGPAGSGVPSAPRSGSSSGSAPRTTAPAASPQADGYPVRTKPPVRKLARDLGVDLTTVTPTGPGGIVTREDVVDHAAQTEPRALATYPADDAPWLASGVVSEDGRSTTVPAQNVRKRTAEAMVASAFTAPHVTVFHTLDVTRTMKLVRRLKADREFADVRVTPLLITAKALLLAVRRHPEINASWDDARQEITYKHYVNLGIAAATPRGLVVPNIKDAHRLTLLELAQELAQLTATARAGKTRPSDMADGTITITNVGVFGIDTGTPILVPGESAILAFGAIRKQPWVHKGKVRPRWVTQLALSVDHRLVDGELATRFLADVSAILEDPAQALVWG